MKAQWGTVVGKGVIILREMKARKQCASMLNWFTALYDILVSKYLLSKYTNMICALLMR